MLKNLAMLFKLRAWLRSGTLKAGGTITILGAIQTWLSSQDGTDVLATVAGLAHLSAGTLNGLVLGLMGLIMLAARAKTEWSLREKVAGADLTKPSG